MNSKRGVAGVIEREGHRPDAPPVATPQSSEGRGTVADTVKGAGRRRSGALRRWLSSHRATRLVTMLAVLTIVPLITLSTITITSTYSTLSDAARKRLVDDSTLVSLFIATQLVFQGMQIESAYAGRPAMVAAFGDGEHANFDKAVISANLQDLRYLVPTIATSFVTDASGKYWGDSNPAAAAGSPGQDYSSTDWYQAVRKTGKPYVSSGYVTTGAKPVVEVAIAAPIVADGRNAPKGTVLGVLVGTYPQSTPSAIFAGIPGHQAVDIQVTDQKGNVISSSFGTPTKMVRDGSEGVAAALQGRYAVKRLDIAGKDAFAAYSPMVFVGWTLRASLPASEALSDANRLLVQVLVITIVLVALIAFAKVLLYFVLRDLQGTRLELATANATLEQRVAARTAELEASNRELEAFSFSVSHDLRAPLRSIDGFSRILLEESEEELSPETTRMLGKVRASAQEMGTLIDELLGFSRLSHVELHKERVEPTELVNSVITEMRQDHPDRAIEFTVGDLPPCYADRARLSQVLRNLIGNSVKFTAPRESARIEVGSAPATEPGRVTYYVKDNGVGFDMRYAGRLFGPFERMHRTDEFPGTGVGLSLVKRVIERHGGRVWAEAAVDEGATFYFTLEDGNVGG